ncbi:MAG: type II toxin-antitoxin system mRNA interferase toxin, RelE/StbE family [Candidatus Taylorbacteria bacterium]|nr:type II toxin-antitoxin system mRNA interferase toxin, RelE/StbE family [Candidatus Taylorbacteria bacterium]
MALEIGFKPSFVRAMKHLEKELIAEVLEKIELFKNPENHEALKVHKLHGALSGRWSLSVNYKIRIVFRHVSKNFVELLAIGDHDVYR